MEGVARRFVEEIREWSNNYEPLFWFSLKCYRFTIGFTFPIRYSTFKLQASDINSVSNVFGFSILGIEIDASSNSEIDPTAKNDAPLLRR